MATVARPAAKPAKAPPAAAKPAPPAAPKRPAPPAASKPRAAVSAPAPSSPARPGRPAAPPAAAAKPATNDASTPVVAALLASIKALEARVSDLAAKQATVRARPRNAMALSDIVEGITPARGDWRAPYHGQTVSLAACTIARGSGGDAADVQIHAGEPARPCLLAIPRDGDLGGDGPAARQAMMIAVHHSPTEDGSAYTGRPMYVSAEQLAAIWAED